MLQLKVLLFTLAILALIQSVKPQVKLIIYGNNENVNLQRRPSKRGNYAELYHNQGRVKLWHFIEWKGAPSGPMVGHMTLVKENFMIVSTKQHIHHGLHSSVTRWTTYPTPLTINAKKGVKLNGNVVINFNYEWCPFKNCKLSLYKLEDRLFMHEHLKFTAGANDLDTEIRKGLEKRYCTAYVFSRKPANFSYDFNQTIIDEKKLELPGALDDELRYYSTFRPTIICPEFKNPDEEACRVFNGNYDICKDEEDYGIPVSCEGQLSYFLTPLPRDDEDESKNKCTDRGYQAWPTRPFANYIKNKYNI